MDTETPKSDDLDKSFDIPENFDIADLGDPNSYYKSLISKPLPQQMAKYLVQKYGFKAEQEYIDFLQTPRFVEEMARHDYLLFFEQVLKKIVKNFHHAFARQIYMHTAITLAPRGVGKSDFFSIGLPIWLAFYEKSSKIMILSETDDQAKRILDDVKQMIEENPILSERLLVKTTAKDSTWNKGTIKTKNKVQIKAKSFTAKLRGFHPSALILDDVLSDQNSLTKIQRENIFNYFARTVKPMATKNAMIQVVGTAQHKDDLLHRLGRSESFSFLKLKAYDEDTKTSIWPEMMPISTLEDYKKTYGIVSFEKEYQNNPMSDNLSLFPLHVLENCLDESLSYALQYDGSDRTHLGADFSMAGVKDGDYTVISSARVDKNNIIRMLWYDRFKDDPDNKEMFIEKQIDTVRDHCQRYKITLGCLESNAFQRIYVDYFKKKTHLPLKGNAVTHSGKNSLQSGIPGIRVLMENGKIKFPYRTQEDKDKTEEIIREFNGLVMSESGRISNQRGYDDIPMSLFHLLQASREVSEMMFINPISHSIKSSRMHSVFSKAKFRPKKY